MCLIGIPRWEDGGGIVGGSGRVGELDGLSFTPLLGFA